MRHTLEATVDAPVGGATKVTGMLPPKRLWFDGSPSGSPDFWHVGLGIETMSQTFTNYGALFQAPGVTGNTLVPVPLTLAGPMLTGGIAGRWLTLLGDFRFLRGSVGGNVAPMTDPLPSGTTSASSLSLVTLGIRPGVRIPLLYGAFSFGIAIDAGAYYFSPKDLGPSQSNSFVDIGVWSALEVKPFCDWGVQGGSARRRRGSTARAAARRAPPRRGCISSTSRTRSASGRNRGRSRSKGARGSGASRVLGGRA